MNIPNHIQQDLIDCINGKAYLEQKARVKVWLREDVENKKSYEEFSRWYYRSLYADLYDKIDVNKAKYQVKLSLQNQLRKRRILQWGSVAASLIVLLSITLLFKMFYQGANDCNLVEQDDYKKAVLQLSTGEEVCLSSKCQLQINDKNASIKQSFNEGMKYSAIDADEEDTIAHELVYNTLTVSRGGEFKTTLADGTQIWLNAQTEIRYPVVFEGNTREVYLKGEAFFKVTHNVDQPFIVHTANITTTVLGTSFNVSAYTSDSYPSVTLEDGAVRVSTEQNTLLIEPGWQVWMDLNKKLVANKVNIKHYSSWREGKLVFHRMSLDQISANLERWYDVQFYFTEEVLRELEFSGGIHKTKPLKFILQLIEETTDVKFIIDNKKITVERGEK